MENQETPRRELQHKTPHKRLARSVRRARKRSQLQPPLRQGVNAARIVLPDLPYRTLREWALASFVEDSEKREISAQLVEESFAKQCFLADGNRPLTPDTPYEVGMRVWVFRPILDEPEVPYELPVVYEDERILVVDKPHGMATIPRGSHVANTVTVAARRQFQNDELVCAHRLDLETAGLVLLTKAPQYRSAYQDMFSRREIHKKYWALAGAPIFWDMEVQVKQAVKGTQDFTLPMYRPPGQLNVEVGMPKTELPTWLAHTKVKVLENYQVPLEALTDYDARNLRKKRVLTEARFTESVAHTVEQELTVPLSLYELMPTTGYLHQLRVLLNYLGTPILGDPLYPYLFSKEEEAKRPYYLQLLAKELAFIDPYTKAEIRLESAQKLLNWDVLNSK